MEEKKEFECFFRTLARYMINNNADIQLCNDGSIKLIDIKTGFEKRYTKCEVLNRIGAYM